MNISVPKDYFLLPKYLFTGYRNENGLVIYTVYKYTTACACERACVCETNFAITFPVFTAMQEECSKT